MTDKSVKYALFIEPDGPLKTDIIEWKKAVKKQLGRQSFCSHPPHATLIVFSSGEPRARIVKHLRQAVAEIPYFRIESRGTIVLADGNGNSAIAYRLDKSEPMFKLQKAVADAIKPFIDRTGMATFCSSRDRYGASLIQYGFPFVGRHWIAHMTIAALGLPLTHPFIAAFRQQTVRHDFIVRRISLWRITGDRHDKEADIPLRGNR